MIKFQIFGEYNLLVFQYLGNFSIDYFRTFVSNIVYQPESANVKKILADLRETNLNSVLTHFDEVVRIGKKILKNDIQVVFWVDKPSTTAPVYLLVNQIKGYNLKHCSTLLYAIELLELTVDIEKFELKIKNLKKSYALTKVYEENDDTDVTL